MLTKTGLRARDVQRRGTSLEPPPTGIGKKLPPVTNTIARRGFHAGSSGGGALATPRMLRARRQAAAARFSPVSIPGRGGGEPGGAKGVACAPGAAGRGVGAWEVVPSSSSSAGRRRGGGRSMSASRAGSGRSRSGSTRGRRVETYRTGGVGGGAGRSRSTGRIRRGRTPTPAARRPVRARPEWDDSLRDMSQYRLTPEEALRRKISLVSKHNTLVFGLGGASFGGVAEKATAGEWEKADPAAPVAARGLTLQQAEFPQQQQQQQRQQQRQRRRRSSSARASSAAASDDERRKSLKNPGLLRGASSVSSIYGGSLGTRRRGKGASALEPSATAADVDLTAVGEERGEDPDEQEEISANDATMTLYPRRSGGDASIGEAPVAAAALSRPRLSGGGGGGGGGDHEQKRNGGRGAEVDGASSLAGIEEGIEAFSRRVGRLEACRALGLHLAEDKRPGDRRDNATKEGGGRESEGRCRGGEPDGETSLCLEDCREGSAATGRPIPTSPVGTPAELAAGGSEGGTDNVSAAAAGHDEIENKSRPPRSWAGRHSPQNPWIHGAPSSPASSRRPRRHLGAPAAGRSSQASDDEGEGEGEVDLVRRIQQLETQVLLASSSAAPAAAARTEAGRAAVAAAGEDGRQEERTESEAGQEVRMRAVIADLLSLSALLLERATTAERRLRDAAACGCVRKADVGDGGGGADARCESTVQEQGQAETLSDLVGDYGSNNSPSPPPQPTKTQAPGTVFSDTAKAAAAYVPGETKQHLETFDPRPPSSPSWKTKQRCASAGDCWGQALEAVGHLVDSEPLGFHHEEEDNVVVVAASTDGCPSPPPMQGAAGDAAYLRGRRSARQGIDPSGPPAPSPVPIDGATGSAFADSWLGAPGLDPARFTLSRSAAAPSAQKDAHGWRGTRQEQEGEEGEGEEEALRAQSAMSAPTPSRKPQHPFGGARSGSPPMRSTRWLRSHVGRQGTVEEPCAPVAESQRALSARELSIGDEDLVGRGSDIDIWGHGAQGGGGGGGGGGGSKVATTTPPIGQWYTPALAHE